MGSWAWRTSKQFAQPTITRHKQYQHNPCNNQTELNCASAEPVRSSHLREDFFGAIRIPVETFENMSTVLSVATVRALLGWDDLRNFMFELADWKNFCVFLFLLRLRFRPWARFVSLRLILMDLAGKLTFVASRYCIMSAASGLQIDDYAG